MLPQSTAEHYREQQRLAVATVAAARRAWSQMGADFDASWRAVGPRLVTVAAAAQLGAVRQGVAYLPAVLAETDQPDDPAGAVITDSLVGVAADGRSLDGLLYGAVTTSKTAAKGRTVTEDGTTTLFPGRGSADALAVGARWLDMAMASLVSDAARDAVGVGIVARPRIGGYVRMLNTPSCARCAILAGKWFRWNTGFLRHPRCDCRHIPSSEDRAGDFRTDPDRAFASGQVRGMSQADRKAVEDGADLGQVVNAQRGMYDVRGVKATRVNARQSVRLRPEAIYELAEDRADAIRLLRRFGYLT